MSTTFPQKPEATPVRMLWTSPVENLWIGNRGGEYAGMIEFSEGHFVARDRTNAVIDVFTDIPSAQLAVLSAAETPRSLFESVAAGLRLERPVELHRGARMARHYRRTA